jgi:hypothetical protein
MLQRLGRPVGSRELVRKAFERHLRRLNDWLPQQPNIKLLHVGYGAVIAAPRDEASRCNDFLEGRLNADAMAKAVDPRLYRNRKLR